WFAIACACCLSPRSPLVAMQALADMCTHSSRKTLKFSFPVGTRCAFWFSAAGLQHYLSTKLVTFSAALSYSCKGHSLGGGITDGGLISREKRVFVMATTAFG